MVLNPEIWGPHYWFFIYTLALSYPLNPNDTTKKKYYDFIQNLPIFIPDVLTIYSTLKFLAYALFKNNIRRTKILLIKINFINMYIFISKLILWYLSFFYIKTIF